MSKNLPDIRLVVTNPETAQTQESWDEFLKRLKYNRDEMLAKLPPGDERELLEATCEYVDATDKMVKLMMKRTKVL